MTARTAEARPIEATELLRRDHRRIKELFLYFERAPDHAAKRRAVETAILELIVHTALEEEIFYPAVRRHARAEELIDEAVEEHHVAKLLIAELADMRPGDRFYDAKVTVLADGVRKHMEQEEAEILPKLERLGIDLRLLGHELVRRKRELMDEIRTPVSAKYMDLAEPELPPSRRRRRAHSRGSRRRSAVRARRAVTSR